MMVEPCFTSTPRPQVSILVPTLNEAGNMEPLLSALDAALAGAEFTAEVVIVDGGSTDGTPDLARSWSGRVGVRVFAATGRKGLAGDVLEAAANASGARGDVIVVMDADLSHPPDKVAALAMPVLRDEMDMAIGSRHVAGGGTPGWPLRRRLASRLAAALARPLVSVSDPMSGFFAVRRERLLNLDPGIRGFKIGLELLAAGGDELRTVEVPITFRDRIHGRSKLGRREIAAYLKRLLALAGSSFPSDSFGPFTATIGAALLADCAAFAAARAAGATITASHLVSFAAMALVLFAACHRWVCPPASLPRALPRRLGRFLAVAMPALCLRGGVLALVLNLWPEQYALAAIAAALASLTVLVPGCAFYAFAPARSGAPTAAEWRLAALAIIAYSLALRLVFVGLPDLLPEEAYYWNYAQHPALSYLDHPPMVAWLIWLGTALFGDTELGVRIAAPACWLVAAAFVFGLARNLYGRTAALVAVLLMAALPFFMVFGLFMTPDTSVVACWAGSLYFLERATIGGRRKAWWGVGACLGLGMLSKYTIALLGPAALAFVLLDHTSRRWLIRPEPYAAALLAAVLCWPVLLWNAQHDWASFGFQGARRWHQAPEFSLHLLAGSMVALVTPLGFIGAFAHLRRRMPLASGVVSALDLDRRRRLFLGCFLLVPLSAFVAFSVRHEPKLNWTGPIWLAALPALAAGMAHVPVTLAADKARRAAAGWSLTVLIALVALGGFLHFLVLGFPGVRYPNIEHLPVAWEELGREIEAIEDGLESRIGDEPVVIGLDKYFIASELAFYRQRSGMSPDEILEREGIVNTTGRHLVNWKNSLMFDYWSAPMEHEGRAAILVAFVAEDLSEPLVESHFHELGPVIPLEVQRDGAALGRCYYRVGYGYHALVGPFRGVAPPVVRVSRGEEAVRRCDWCPADSPDLARRHESDLLLSGATPSPDTPAPRADRDPSESH